jgi:Ca2+-binding EF-hand superfamily protein
LSAFTNPTLIRQGQYLSGVASKLGESKDLSIEDLFKLVDKDGSRKISSDEFQEFLRRTGLEISNHKLKEIFISVKGDE